MSNLNINTSMIFKLTEQNFVKWLVDTRAHLCWSKLWKYTQKDASEEDLQTVKEKEEGMNIALTERGEKAYSGTEVLHSRHTKSRPWMWSRFEFDSPRSDWADCCFTPLTALEVAEQTVVSHLWQL